MLNASNFSIVKYRFLIFGGDKRPIVSTFQADQG